jgi:hypothetical protein
MRMKVRFDETLYETFHDFSNGVNLEIGRLVAPWRPAPPKGGATQGAGRDDAVRIGRPKYMRNTPAIAAQRVISVPTERSMPAPSRRFGFVSLRAAGIAGAAVSL